MIEIQGEKKLRYYKFKKSYENTYNFPCETTFPSDLNCELESRISKKISGNFYIVEKS